VRRLFWAALTAASLAAGAFAMGRSAPPDRPTSDEQGPVRPTDPDYYDVDSGTRPVRSPLPDRDREPGSPPREY
jgi:hypothetical protein